MKGKLCSAIALVLLLVLISGCVQLPQADCGDGVCDKDAGESIITCPKDCGSLIAKPCGNGTCEETENWKNCAVDCKQPVKPVCGDGVCEKKEEGTCLQDCPIETHCGDGTCDAKERANPNLCPFDCQTECQEDDRTDYECPDGSYVDWCQCIGQQWRCTENPASLCEIEPGPFCGDGDCGSGESCSSCPGDCGACPIETYCGDEECNGNEDCETCPGDCGTCQTETYCGDGTCDADEECGTTDTAPECNLDCGECAVESGESRFGVGHVEDLALKSKISELGDIYSRINIGLDAFGWKKVKGTEAARLECEDCCNPTLSRTCSCETGSFYFCTPTSRDIGFPGKDTADGFYADNYEILFSVWPGSYGENEPKDVEDLLSKEYPANEQTYKDFIEYLMQQYPDVEYWEVGNEADNPQFWGDTPEDYVRLFTLTSNEIKSYCPECKVGISLVGPYSPDEWFNAIIGVCNDIDFLDLHQYHSETMDELKEFEENDLIRWKNSCPGVEILSTETGIPSEPITFKGVPWVLGTSKTKQAQDSIKYLTMMFNAGYSKIYYYLINQDFIPGVLDTWEYIGLLYEDFTPKESYSSYKTMIEKVDYFTSITKLTDGQYRYEFSHKDPVYVLWCDSGTCPLSSEISGTVKVTFYPEPNGLGEWNVEIKDASALDLNESPVFVEMQ